MFSHLFPEQGSPAKSSDRLAMITIFQFAEGLSDRAAADAASMFECFAEILRRPSAENE
jgi:hypothetical protein